ncbi:6-bladed beta-propeller, partial [Parabacteroides sp. OttesenSCG-928-J18]|nr:6-bladed beta-propeller [Parabacteroides sp. OttesenSCG-928-J18]
VVYNLDGAFKRNIKTDEGIRYENIYSFDREHLIGDVGDNGKATEKTFRIITKENGSLAKEIKIPFEQKKSTITTDANGKLQSLYYYAPLLPYHDSWILTEASSDTIFCLRPDFSVNPFIVNTPSVQSSVFANLFLFSKIQTDRYYFMEKVSNKEKIIKTDLLYDTKEKAIYEYTLFNDDYSNKQQVTMANSGCSNAKIVFWQKMEAHSLVESFQKGELKGKLKTIAANLDNESNPVIMLVKIK